MNDRPDLQPLGKLLSSRHTIKPPAYQWQDFALRIIDELGVPSSKRGSVFAVCKKFPKPVVEKALNDTKELCKTGECWKYFFKVLAGPKP